MIIRTRGTTRSLNAPVWSSMLLEKTMMEIDTSIGTFTSDYDAAQDDAIEMMELARESQGDGHENGDALLEDVAGNPAGEYHAPAEPLLGHTRCKLSYDGIVLPDTHGADFCPSGVDANTWSRTLSFVHQEVRAFNFSRGWRHLFLFCLKSLTTVVVWYFVNIQFFGLIFEILESVVTFNDVLNSGIYFTVFYVTEWAVFSMPGTAVGYLGRSFEAQLYTKLKERVFGASQDIDGSSVRLVLRFAKGSRHPPNRNSMAYALANLFCPGITRMGAGHRYDLHVLPWDIKELKVITVRCPRCEEVCDVDPRQVHFRCMRCLACSSLALPALAPDEYGTPETRRIPQWISAPSRLRFRPVPSSTVV